MRKTQLFTVLLIVALCSTMFLSLIEFPIVKADGENWLSGYDYRIPATISNSAGAGTGYQIPLEISYNHIEHGVEAGWNWFNRPVGAFYNNVTYYGWIDIDGDAGISAFNHTSGSTSSFTLHSNLDDDDHCAPAVIIMPNGKIIAFYSTHNEDEYIRWRVSTNAESIASWETEDNFATDAWACYPQPYYLPDEDLLYVFYRGYNGTLAYWGYRTSDDYTATFSSENVIYWGIPYGGYNPSPYTIPVLNGEDRFDFSVTRASQDTTPHRNVWHYYYQDGSFYQSDGTLICADSELPFSLEDDATCIYNSTVTGYDCWVEDTSVDPNTGYPVIGFAEFIDADDEHLYHYAYWNGTAWTDEVMCDGGGAMCMDPSQYYYSGGIAISRTNVSIVFASVGSDDNDFDILKFETGDSGETWISETVCGSDVICARPQIITDGENDELIFWEGTYPDFYDWVSEARIFIEDYREAGKLYLAGKAQPDFDDLRFTDNDGETELDYWFEINHPGDYCYVWVEVADDLSSSDATVYAYYGNSEASSQSSGINTFPILFDDFLGSSLNTTIWNLWTGSGCTVSGGELHLYGTATTATSIRTQTDFGLGVALRTTVKCGADPDVRNSLWRSDDNVFRADNSWDDYNQASETLYAMYRDSGHGNTQIDNTPASQNIWYTIETQATTSHLYFLLNDVQYASQSVSWGSAGDFDVAFLAGSQYSSAYWDWSLVRKFTDPEPELDEWGEEQYYWDVVNSAPVNGSASINNMDDSNNLYAQVGLYTAISNASDDDGYDDINYMELSFKQSSSYRATFRYTVGTDTFSVEAGGSEWSLDASSSAESVSSIELVVTWVFAVQWDATEESDVDLEVHVMDDMLAEDTDSAHTDYCDVVCSMVTDSFSATDSRINLGGSATLSGVVRYANDPSSSTASSLYPPNAEFTSVDIHDASHSEVGSDPTIVDGAFSASFNIPSAVQLNTYHVWLDMSDADYADGDAGDGDSASIIGDRIRIDSLDLTDSRINADGVETSTLYATASLEYDDHSLGSGDSLEITGVSLSWDAGDSRFEGSTESSSSVGSSSYNGFNSGSEATYGITEGNINGQSATLIFDKLQVSGYSVSDSRVDLDENVNVDVTVIFDYDDAPCITATLTINGESTVHQGSGVYRSTVSESSVQEDVFDLVAVSEESTYDITTVDQNGQSSTVIWDRILVSWEASTETPFNLQVVIFSVEFTYEYDSENITAFIYDVNRDDEIYQDDLAVNQFIDWDEDDSHIYDFITCSESTYGLTGFVDPSDITVEWSGTGSGGDDDWTDPHDLAGAVIASIILIPLLIFGIVALRRKR